MREWYRIEAKADRKAVIGIYGFIGDSWDSESPTANRFFKQVQDLDVDQIELHINSEGGSLPDGNAIYNLLKAHTASVHVVVDGMALSAASVIAMAGDVVEMPENAMMMIHDPLTIAAGNAADMRKTAEVLDKWKGGIVASYRDKTKLPEEKIRSMMTDETWMTAREAMLLGFADQVTGAVDIEARFEREVFNRFMRAPAQIVNVFAKKEDSGTMEITAEFLKKNHPAIVAALIAEVLNAAFIKDKHPQLVTELTAEASANGAIAERKRIQDVLALSMPGHEDLVQALAFDGKTTPAEAAVQVLNAEKKVRQGVKDKLGRDAVTPLGHVEPPVGEPGRAPEDKNLPVEERAKASWDADGKLRVEFDGDYAAYLAYFRAVENKSVKVLKK